MKMRLLALVSAASIAVLGTVSAQAQFGGPPPGPPEDIAPDVLKKLEAQMYKHAQNLEFEEAARLRDQIHQLREQALR